MKNKTISVIRMISMLMIISCHILQGLDNRWAFWVNVGVQVFFVISGFLNGKKEIKDTKEFYIKKIQKILVPYIIIFIIFLFLEKIILNNNYSLSLVTANLVGLGGLYGTIAILSHTWFVTYILGCYVIIPILQKYFSSKKFVNNIIKLIILIISFELFEKLSGMNLNLCWINNFIIGYFYSRCCIDKKSRNIYELGVFIVFILIIPFAIIYQENLNVTLPSIMNSNSNIIIQYGHIFLGTVLFIALYKILNKIKIKEKHILSFSDKYSYYIYLVHQIFILNYFSVLFLTKNMIVNIILIFILSFISGIILKIINDFILKTINKVIFLIKKVKL